MLSRIFRGRNREGQGGVLRVFWETFIRDNRIVPPVLAIVALLVFSWVVAGSFIGGQDDAPVSNTQSVAPGAGGEVAQSDGGSAQVAPEVENPNAESFAAYESKDPFRNLFTPASADTGSENTGDGNTGGEDRNNGNDGGSGNGNAPNDPRRTDPTEDPASNQYDNGQQNNGNNSGNNNINNNGSNDNDTDGDGTDDSDEDSGGGSGNGNLFDSGGTLPDPGR